MRSLALTCTRLARPARAQACWRAREPAAVQDILDGSPLYLRIKRLFESFEYRPQRPSEREEEEEEEAAGEDRLREARRRRVGEPPCYRGSI